MRLNLFEAEDDYIRVGNIMLPKDAREYGYDSYDTITRKTQQKYDDEKEAERLAKEREEAERQRQAFIKEHETEIGVARDILESDKTADEKLEDLFKPFVKDSGESDTQGGEIVRAYCGISSCYYEDELYYEGYGLQSCGNEATFLIDETNETIADLLKNYADKHIEDYKVNEDAYEVFIKENLAGAVVDYLENSLELFATPPVADSLTYAKKVDEYYIEDWEEKGRCHDYDAELGMDAHFSELYEAGIVDADDVAEDFVDYGSFCDANEVDVYTNGDRIEISNLNRDELDMFERDFYKSFQKWAKEKWIEHEAEIEEYFAEEDEDEDYDEDEE